MGALAAAKRKAHVIADVVAHAPTDFAAKPMADAPALARSDAAAEPKTDVVADLVAIAQTDFAAKPMADAPALARSDAAADSQALVGALARSEAGAYAATDASALAGAIPKTNPSSHAKTDTLADGDAGRPHGGSSIFADAAALFAAEFEADKSADARTVGPTHTAADAPPDPESLSGAVE